MHRRHLELQR
jgi:hypothetical protein